MAKAEISWKSRAEDGTKREVYAQHVGDRWKFYARPRRFDQWEEVENPPLEDWLELLDSVKRRIGRMLLRPEEERNVKKSIMERFPGTKLD